MANLYEPIPITEYSADDIFEIRTSPNIAQYTLYTYYNSIILYEILPGNYQYDIGSFVYIEPDESDGTRQIFKVIGENLLKIVEYGGSFNRKSYTLYPLEDVSNSQLSTLIVLKTSLVIDAGLNTIPDPISHVINFNEFFFINSLIFYNYQIDRQYIIVIDALNDLRIINNSKILYEYGFIQRRVITCAMNVPNWSFPQNPVCIKMSLDILILPNLHVKNYNKLLSFFPYVIVRLYNTDAAQYSRYGNMISNNLNSSNAQFICPIGNLQNPETIRFVEVTSSCIQMLKFDPTQNIYFEVLLPDGNTLEYENSSRSLIATQLDKFVFTITDTVACILSLTIDL